MKKYVLKSTGQEVSLGQKLIKFDPSKLNHFSVIELTEKILENFIKGGLISVVSEKEDKGSCTQLNIEYYIEHLANRLNWKKDNLFKYLSTLEQINETAVFSVLLREVAIVIDKKYPDHIERSKEIYSISLANGEIIKIKDIHKIKNFRNFSAFRSLEDALCAKHILKDFIKDLFVKNGK